MASFANSRRGHRVERIERAAAEAFEFEILPSLSDPYLEDLHVLRVEASTNLSCLTVIVIPGERAELDEEEIKKRLLGVEGRLRSELAGILRIKKMPAVKLRYWAWPSLEKKEAAHGDLE